MTSNPVPLGHALTVWDFAGGRWAANPPSPPHLTVLERGGNKPPPHLHRAPRPTDRDLSLGQSGYEAAFTENP